MCEPLLSVLQFPTDDDNGNSLVPKLEAIPAPEDYWGKMRKKIDSWFHYAYMGSGHSEAMARLSASARLWLPKETKYENQWYFRRTLLDGRYNGPQETRHEALSAANVYSTKVATGNLTTLRQFLNHSIRKTARPMLYYEAFQQMLNKAGKDIFLEKMRRLFGGIKDAVWKRLQESMKVLLWFTGQRRLLICEWSDDTNLW